MKTGYIYIYICITGHVREVMKEQLTQYRLIISLLKDG